MARRKLEPMTTKTEYCNEDIIKLVAKRTRYSQDTVRGVVNAYTEFIAEFMKSSACPEDAKITIPNIGKLVLKKVMGLKTGSTYKRPLNFGIDKDENGNSMMELVTLEEDRPDFLKPWLEVSPTFKKDMREISEERWRQANGKINKG